MTDLTLYMAPGACSFATSIILEELGLEFESRVVRFMGGEHKSPEFKLNNPKGKIPVLIHNDKALTENVAIITYLNEIYGGLLPATDDALEKARQIADLCFCSSTLHPLVTRIRMPMLFAGIDNAPLIKRAGCEAMDEYFQVIEDRLHDQPWWFGDKWSAMDGYLYWIFWRVKGAGYDVNRYPAFCEHAQQMEIRPSVQRAVDRETQALKTLESEGFSMVMPTVEI